MIILIINVQNSCATYILLYVSIFAWVELDSVQNTCKLLLYHFHHFMMKNEYRNIHFKPILDQD